MISFEIDVTKQSSIKESDCHPQGIDNNNNYCISSTPLPTTNNNNYISPIPTPTPTLILQGARVTPFSSLVSTHGNPTVEPVIDFPGTAIQSSTIVATPTVGYILPEQNSQPYFDENMDVDIDVDVDLNVTVDEEAPEIPSSQDSTNQEGKNLVRGNRLLLCVVIIGVIISSTLHLVRRLRSKEPPWNQIGSTLSGSYNSDHFGRVVTLSKRGTIMAAAALPYAAQFHFETDPWVVGFVQAFQYINNDWTPLGNQIQVGDTGDTNGVSMDLSKNGKMIAIGIENSIGSATTGEFPAGSMKVYWFNGYIWLQFGQELIVGKQSNYYDDYGDYIKAIAISGDGRIVAGGGVISTRQYHNASSRVYVFNFSNEKWIPMGETIMGSNIDADCMGLSVDLSDDGFTLAVGTLSQNVGGIVEVFRYQDESFNWNAFGQVLNTGVENKGSLRDDFGKSVSLSEDGYILAVGNPSDPYGHVQVYQWMIDMWTVMGSPISGHENMGQFGCSVELSSNGQTLAVGSGYTKTIQVFRWIDSIWEQVGQGIEGSSAAIAGDGNVVVGGIPSKSGSDRPGQVRVYAWNKTLFDLTL